jgi:hypothetical protein
VIPSENYSASFDGRLLPRQLQDASKAYIGAGGKIMHALKFSELFPNSSTMK